MATHSSIVAWKIHGQRSLTAYSPWDLKDLGITERMSTRANYTTAQRLESHSSSSQHLECTLSFFFPSFHSGDGFRSSLQSAPTGWVGKEPISPFHR